MDAVILIGNNIDNLKFDISNAYVIGVDKGCEYALKNKIKLDLAIGDFDSWNGLNSVNCKVIKLNPIKDNTDTYEAINLVKDYDNIYILGGIQGNRIEHFIANINLLHHFPNLIFIDDNSKIFLLKKDSKIHKENYKYISLFALENVSNLTIKDFKYNLENYELLTSDSLCISNEFSTDIGHITYESGKLMAILSKNDNKVD